MQYFLFLKGFPILLRVKKNIISDYCVYNCHDSVYKKLKPSYAYLFVSIDKNKKNMFLYKNTNVVLNTFHLI